MIIVYFIWTIIVLQYFRRMYLQKLRQHHNIIEATRKKRVGTAFEIFNLLSDNISSHFFISNCVLANLMCWLGVYSVI